MSDATSGPVVIGGIGGSGTRLVAATVRELGVHLGEDLNESLDNLWATLLLRRPGWYLESRLDGGREIHLALSVLDRASKGRLEIDDAVRQLLDRAGRDLQDQGLSETWVRDRTERLLGARPSDVRGAEWGWKEPNSHLYVEFLARHFGHAKYLHVIRHGLDMAFSANQWQVQTWGWLFGLPDTHRVDPATSLDYWLRANRAAIEVATDSLGPRFLLVSYDDFCASPESGARNIAEFLAMELAPSRLARISQLVGSPRTTGRWRRLGTDPFRPEQLAEVAAMGFAVDS